MFSLFKKKAPAVPLWQAHQFVSVLDEGLLPVEASPPDLAAVLALAKDQWDDLELGLDGHRPSSAVLKRARHSGHIDGEVPTGQAGVVLAMVLPGPGQAPAGHILWDHSAAQSEPSWSCPASGHEGPVTAPQLALGLAKMPGHDEPFGVLARRRGTFMQVYAMDGAFLVEHQLVNPRAHYQAPAPMTMQDALDLLESYRLGTPAWMTAVNWRHDPM